MVLEKLQGVVPQRTPFAGPLAIPVNADNRDQRVRDRFRLDKYLAGARIDIIAEGNGVRLRGQLGDEVLKARAIDLAESTEGVEQVIDEIQLEKTGVQ
jgi:osmotically-inducible protein OsmY